MPRPVVIADPPTDELVAGFAAIRAELHVPEGFPPAVEAAAAAAANVAATAERTDRRDLALVTLDPPGSRDLDQAFAIDRRPGGGWRVWYAIADVAAFVRAGDPVDVEAHRRGVTCYSPDERAPLHPDALGVGAASLLPDADRPAVLWGIDLDGDGAVTGDPSISRAIVRSRGAYDYPAVDAALAAGTAAEPFVLLRDVGSARQAQEVARGGVSLDLPEQQVVLDDGHYRLAYRTQLPVEGWNAQLSLLTGIVAASIMLRGKVGLLRTVPPADAGAMDRLRRAASALGAPWPKDLPYPEFVRGIDRSTTAGAALIEQAAHTLRGAGYLAFEGSAPGDAVHAAVAAPYAHVTAPLRRLADRFANEVVLALGAGQPVPSWAADALPLLPEVMAKTSGRDHALGRAVVDFVEAISLRHRVGEHFDATVIDKGIALLHEPPVIAPFDGKAPLGARVTATLSEVDVELRRVRLSVASAG